MKKVDSSGNTKYYYYKKKVGRHKKRGPKKKPRKRGRSWQEPWNFKLILCNSKKQVKYLGVFHDTEEVEYAKKLLLQKNSEVVFPKKYINNVRNSKHVEEADYEYVILKKIRNSEMEPNSTMLRNQYGAFVEHKTTSKNWVVYDKFPCVSEETFWVYGKNPKTDRKTFQWVYENLALYYAEEKNNIVLIYLFGNKVIFKYEDDFNFIICKNVSDAIRVYNEIENRAKKIKNILMTGYTTIKQDRGKQTYEMISEKTGWPKDKICRYTTRA